MKKKNREKYRPPSVHSYWSYKNFEPYLKKINNAVVLCIIIITKRFFCNIMERFFGETWKTIFYFGETCKWIFKDGELVKEHTWWNVKMKIIVSEWWIGKCIFFSKWWITHKNLSVRYTCPKIRHLVRKLHAPWKYTNFAPFLKKINWE